MQNTNVEEPGIDKHFILDVNIIFSGVLSRKEIYRKLFSEYKLYTPDFAFIELNLTLLTRDKKLYEGLKAQGFEKIKLFDEFIREIV